MKLIFAYLPFFRIVENDLYKQDWRSRKKVQIFQYVVLKWTLALLIGLGTGLVAFFNNLAVENIAGFKLLLTNNLMLKERYEFHQMHHGDRLTSCKVVFLSKMHSLNSIEINSLSEHVRNHNLFCIG